MDDMDSGKYMVSFPHGPKRDLYLHHPTKHLVLRDQQLFPKQITQPGGGRTGGLQSLQRGCRTLPLLVQAVYSDQHETSGERGRVSLRDFGTPRRQRKQRHERLQAISPSHGMSVQEPRQHGES